MSGSEILVVGLGPSSPDLLTRETLEALRSPRVFLRTRIHPTLDRLPESAAWRSFDQLYEDAPDFGALYDRIVDELLAAARQGSLVYAVPGSPLFAEATVRRLRQRASQEGVPVRVLPAVGFVDVVASALDLDPVAGNLQLVDALDLAAFSEREPFAGGTLPLSNLRPALVAQLYSKPIASAAKLALLTAYSPDLEVTLVAGAGTPRQAIEARALSELDHGSVDHLTTLYLPAVEPLAWPRSSDAVRQITARLRAPEGCPWDREQTHVSLTRYMIEEAYEAVEALEQDEPGAVEEELGDVLLQVFLHAQIAEEAGEFSLDDIYQTLGAKLVRRHPHVFGEAVAETAGDVLKTWNEVKRQERAANGAEPGEQPEPFGEIPLSLPALARAQTMVRRARAQTAGGEWPSAPAQTLNDDTLGRELARLVAGAEAAGLDAEQALRRWTRAFEAAHRHRKQ